MMNEDNKTVRSTKEIKQGLLKKAIAEGRGREMITTILWRLAQVRHDAAKDELAIEKAKRMNGQPKSVRMLNTLARHEDSPLRFSAEMVNEVDEIKGFIHSMPETVQ